MLFVDIFIYSPYHKSYFGKNFKGIIGSRCIAKKCFGPWYVLFLHIFIGAPYHHNYFCYLFQRIIDKPVFQIF